MNDSNDGKVSVLSIFPLLFLWGANGEADFEHV
jgi:hypothetical protein